MSALQALGHDVWYDEKLPGGSEWVAMIGREIEKREVFAIVLTPDAWASDWVQRELGLAFATHRTIIPIRLKETAVTGFLRAVQHVDVTGMGAAPAADRLAASLPTTSLASEAQPTLSPSPGRSLKACLVVLDGRTDQKKIEIGKNPVTYLVLDRTKDEIVSDREPDPWFGGYIVVIYYRLLDGQYAIRSSGHALVLLNDQSIHPEGQFVLRPNDKIKIYADVDAAPDWQKVPATTLLFTHC